MCSTALTALLEENGTGRDEAQNLIRSANDEEWENKGVDATYKCDNAKCKKEELTSHTHKRCRNLCNVHICYNCSQAIAEIFFCSVCGAPFGYC